MSGHRIFIFVLLLSSSMISSVEAESIPALSALTISDEALNLRDSNGMNLTYTTSTGQQQITIYNVDFSIEPAREQSCAFFHLGLTAGKGQHLTGNLRSTSRIDFYVLYASNYQLLLKDFHCKISNPVIAGEDLMTYSFTFVAPDNADYELLFFNYDKEAIPKVSFTLTTTGLATTTIVLPVQSTQTSIQITTGQTVPVAYDMLLMMAALALITLTCVMAYGKFARSRRLHTQIEPDSRYARYLAKLERLRDSGTISDDTYSRLKSEYENKRKAAAEDA